MKREEQIALFDSVVERLEQVADRVMSEPVIRESVTRRADEKYAHEYEVSTLRVRRYG